MFETTQEHRLTSRAVGYFVATPAVFSLGCLVLSELFTLSDLANVLARLTVYMFLGGYPILIVVELLLIFSRYDDPTGRKFSVAALLLAAGGLTWMVTIFLALHLLQFHT